MRTKTPASACAFVMLFYCLACYSPLMAQQKNRLEFKHSSFGLLNKKYFLDDKKISKSKVAELLQKENQEAYAVFKGGRTLYTVSIILYASSCAVFIYGFFDLLSNHDDLSNNGLTTMLIGLGGLVPSTIVGLIANGKFKKAAVIYSSGTSSTGRINLNFGITRSHGVGLTLSF